MSDVIADSPLPQPSTLLPSNPSRVRAHSTLSSHTSPVALRGAVQKRSSNDRTRPVSTAHVARLYQHVIDQSAIDQSAIDQSAIDQSAIGQSAIDQASNGGSNHLLANTPPWPATQSCRQLEIYPSSVVEPYPQWLAPTPPHSDPGIPSLAVGANERSAHDYAPLDHPTASADMSNSLTYLLPTQYGSSQYPTEASAYPMDNDRYIPPVQVTQPASSSATAAYAPTTATSGPALYPSRGHDASSTARARHSEMQAPNTAAAHPYDHDYRRISSPYEGAYSVAPSQSIPSLSGMTHSPLPSPHIGGAPSSAPSVQPYSSSIPRTSSMYDGVYHSQAYTTAPPPTQMYAPTHSYPPQYASSGMNDTMSKPTGPVGAEAVRVINARPKPQCWEHGCNGRQFSTFSNLLRHQREKSGTATKSYCPRCGAEFTRTTARNGHLAHDKCTKPRRPSDGQ